MIQLTFFTDSSPLSLQLEKEVRELTVKAAFGKPISITKKTLDFDKKKNVAYSLGITKSPGCYIVRTDIGISGNPLCGSRLSMEDIITEIRSLASLKRNKKD